MNDWLAQMYGTAGASEETQKLANVDLFCKLAADNNIDLSQLSQDEIGDLYTQVFPEESAKLAEEKDEEDEEEKKKKELAAEHVEEKKAFQEKFAEADLMGRVMAHSFNQELALIKEGGDFGKTVRKGWESAKGHLKRYGELMSGSKQRELKSTGDRAVAAAKRQAGGGYASEAGAKKIQDKATEIAGKRYGAAKEEGGKVLKARLATGAGVAAIGGGAALAAGRKKDKEASAQAFEELSANQAIKIASVAGYDDEEAYTRVNAVYVLGLGESEKIASVTNTEDALHIRGLEYLEAAGYPVNWSEIFSE